MNLDKQEFFAIFLCLVVFSCAVGMMTATAITLNDEVSDKCVAQKITGNPNPYKLKKLSYDSIVAGGFGVVGGFFSFVLALYLLVWYKSSKDHVLYVGLIFAGGIALAVLGSLQLVQANNPQERCGDINVKNSGAYKIPVIEIATTIFAGLIIMGFLSPMIITFLQIPHQCKHK